MNKKRCIACGEFSIVSRRRSTTMCRSCYEATKKRLAKGRTLPTCPRCGGTVSSVKNVTGMCLACHVKAKVPWNKGKHCTPWNKGISKFSSPEEYRANVNLRRKEIRKAQSSIDFVADRIRTLIRNQIKKHRTARRKESKTTDLLGCEVAFFREYIEHLFCEGMSWENYGNGHGKWNIDHILPVSSFDLSTLDSQKKAFHFTNCRPMWAIDNIKKGNRIQI